MNLYFPSYAVFTHLLVVVWASTDFLSYLLAQYVVLKSSEADILSQTEEAEQS